MCGIFGYSGEKLPDEKLLKNALDLLSHRGPDQAGVHIDKNEYYEIILSNSARPEVMKKNSNREF